MRDVGIRNEIDCWRIRGQVECIEKLQLNEYSDVENRPKSRAIFISPITWFIQKSIYFSIQFHEYQCELFTQKHVHLLLVSLLINWIRSKDHLFNGCLLNT